jgi:hypothetical protein
MCRYFETTHTYSGCKLQDEKEDGSPNLLAGFFRRITPKRADEGQPPAEVAPDLHVVTQRTILQCSVAVNDPTQNRLHLDERKCENPMLLPPGNDPLARAGETEHRGGCPVCLAAGRAITEASDVIVVVHSDTPLHNTFLTRDR